MSNPAGDRAERILGVVTGWPGIAIAGGEYGETEFLVNGRSIGHVHGGHQADIPFPRRIRDELVAAGRTGPHLSIPTPAGPPCTSGPMPMPTRRSSCSGSTTTASHNEPRRDGARGSVTSPGWAGFA
jgi:Family of unknown function (DUF5519)